MLRAIPDFLFSKGGVTSVSVDGMRATHRERDQPAGCHSQRIGPDDALHSNSSEFSQVRCYENYNDRRMVW
ncbi:protein of unknown function [Burkholderia multivorans]